VRAALRSIDLEPDPRTLADDDDFAFRVRLIVGPSDGPGEESFDLTVCSPAWLVAQVASKGFIDGRHLLITTIESFSEADLRAYLTKRIAGVSGETWNEVANNLARLGHWEFEDYRPKG
jgi:hypothetical protein